MTLRRDALVKMHRMESAAADWWSAMSEHEQEAYKRAHPQSKFSTNARGVSRPAPSRTSKVFMSDDTVELRPHNHPSGGDGKAYGIFHEGRHLGNVHEFSQQDTHMVPGQRYASHISHSKRFQLTGPDGKKLGGVTGFKTMNDAISYAHNKRPY